MKSNYYVFVILLSVLYIHLSAQNGTLPGDKSKTFNSGEIRLVENPTKVVSAEGLPIGKDVEVIFDGYFKSYKITYTDSDGSKQTMLFKHQGNGKFLFENRTYAIWDMTDMGFINYINITCEEKTPPWPSYKVTNLKK